MEIRVVDRVGDISAAEFDSLDSSAGAPSCYGRTRLREADGRWRVRYVCCTADGRLRAVVPLYTARARSWPDPAYDPRNWRLPDPAHGDWTPGASMLVGGCDHQRSTLHVEPAFRASGQFRRLVAEIAAVAADEGRCLVFPYIYAGMKNALTLTLGDRVGWSLLGSEARLRGVSDPGWEATIGSRSRYSLRQDAKLIAAAGLTHAIRPWTDVEDMACELIACHNQEKGRPDHPEFVRMRYREWTQCDQIECVVFTATSPRVRCLVTALIWQGDIEMYELGLTGEAGTDRHAAYLDLVFHQSMSYARARGLTDIRLGMEAKTPKASRGAVFQDLYGGVLNADDVKALADEVRSTQQEEPR